MSSEQIYFIPPSPSQSPPPPTRHPSPAPTYLTVASQQEQPEPRRHFKWFVQEYTDNVPGVTACDIDRVVLFQGEGCTVGGNLLGPTDDTPRCYIVFRIPAAEHITLEEAGSHHLTLTMVFA